LKEALECATAIVCFKPVAAGASSPERRPNNEWHAVSWRHIKILCTMFSNSRPTEKM